ncbi:regulator of telomere elongation helicase 1 homolog [Macrosteles quadrilineatus]|uniref:regulator of telomere elongation helicase 1 homolog n=1 Tax=Macrosteles quadrilineatus TaxID=74068 RepID=UPI0023E2498A|nr:regulator of telomere elongation helicase 1 homolog [Macrosteles quadrilineatus]
MTEITLRDVPVNFPFQPYKLQEDFMSKVIECLQKGVNGVLESPTGTGKTLSLLCSSLAWLQLKKAQIQANAQGLPTDSQLSFAKVLQSELKKVNATKEPGESSWGDKLGMTKIVYASRTHSQLAQAMKELKRTNYRHMKSAVLGSRDQMCLHPDLAGETGQMKVAMCRMKVSARSCHYYNNLESRKHDQNNFPTEVADIEDLVKFGNKTQCCPYYMSREMMSSADIVFMPYNYLLHPQTRRQQRLTLDNSAVILDEAHNVEKICEESASVQISSTDIALCIAEVTQVMKKFEQDLTDMTDNSPKDFSLEDLCVLKAMFLSLENAVDEVELDTVKDGPDKGKKTGKTFPASYIFELLSKAEITADKIAVLDNSLSNLALFLTTTSDSALSRKGGMLLKFSEFLTTVFNSVGEGGCVKNSDLYYKVYIEPEVPKKSKPDAWSNTKTVQNSTAKVINFWCFSPGFAMRSLLKQGVTSIILTSGTLSPLHATITELGIPIPVQLENPHIIKPSQVCINVLSKGPTGEKLLSTYVNRENPKYLGDLGRILNNFCRIVPGGILMFFPSYPVMQKTISHWQETGLWSQINAQKNLFVEPQRRESLAEVMKDYSAALETEGSRGAVFLAVLRGKVSEGMDFADSHCRAVIITGLPYPPFRDPRVVLKQEYMNNLRRSNDKGLSGKEWYELEATRAVNQAVGRLIRHGSDFGCLLLCDCRFESQNITNALSAWVRPHIVKSLEFGPVYGRVSKFFKAMGVNPPLKPIQSGASFDFVDSKVRAKQANKEAEQKENEDASMKKFLENVVRTTQPKASSAPSPAGLLDALSMPSSQRTFADIKKAVYNNPDEATDSYVEPAPKKRKLKIQPLKFDSTNSEGSDAASNQQRTKSTAEYLRKVKSSLKEEEFKIFKETVKNYSSNSANYDSTVLNLRKVFSDSSTKDLFIEFKRFIKGEDVSNFEDLCCKMFGSSSL